MHYLIQNDGEVDSKAFELLGASSKRDDAQAIGFFGSGSKYAIAVLLRENVPFRVFSGEHEVLFSTEHVEFRGKCYERIVINGVPTSYTTDVGPTWTTWMAVRELLSNAMDEGMRLSDVTTVEEVCGKSGVTRIFLPCEGEVEEFFDNLDTYFIIDEVPLYKGKDFAIYRCDKKDLAIFRRGVRVSQVDDGCVTMFKYDFNDVQITEDRFFTSISTLQISIVRALAACECRDVIETYLLNVMDDRFDVERDLYWTYVDMSDAWHDALVGKRIVSESIAQSFELRVDYVVPDSLAQKLHNCFPDLDVVLSTEIAYEVIESPPSEVLAQLEVGLREVRALGFCDYGVQFKVARFITGEVLALACVTERVVLISEAAIHASDLAETLIEELMHVEGYRDRTREFEQELMRRYVALGRKYAATLAALTEKARCG
jgi:hypothetical protein